MASRIAVVIAVGALGAGGYLLRGSSTAAIEGFPEEMRALARARAHDPNDRRTVRELPRFWSMPWDAQRAAITECHTTGGMGPRPRDCLLDDAENVEQVLEKRTERRMGAYAALVVGAIAFVVSLRSRRAPFTTEGPRA